MLHAWRVGRGDHSGEGAVCSKAQGQKPVMQSGCSRCVQLVSRSPRARTGDNAQSWGVKRGSQTKALAWKRSSEVRGWDADFAF